jgi:hypothetical protein
VVISAERGRGENFPKEVVWMCKNFEKIVKKNELELFVD